MIKRVVLATNLVVLAVGAGLVLGTHAATVSGASPPPLRARKLKNPSGPPIDTRRPVSPKVPHWDETGMSMVKEGRNTSVPYVPISR